MAHKYVAYVGSYTFYGSSKGITIYDVDTEKNYFTKRKEIPVNNSSYLTVSYDHRYLYSIVDEGVSAFRILPDGDLELINTAGIRKQLGHPNPHPDILRRYRELGGTLVTMGSDAHKPFALGFAFDTAKDLLKSCGFTHTVYFEKRNPVFVKL